MDNSQFTLTAMLFNKRTPEITADLTFPATSDDMRRVLTELGAESVTECAIVDFKCGIMPELVAALPQDASVDELNWLAVRLSELSDDELDVFRAASDSGRYGCEIADIINLAYYENIEKLELLPVYTVEQLGEYLSGVGADLYVAGLEMISKTNDSDAADLSQYLNDLLNNFDFAKYAEHFAKSNAVFTKFGCLIVSEPPETLYHSVADIPAELRIGSSVTLASPTIDSGLAAISSEAAKSLTAGGNTMVYAIAPDGARTTLNPMDALNAQLWKSGFTFAVERADLPVAEERKIDTTERGKTDKTKPREER